MTLSGLFSSRFSTLGILATIVLPLPLPSVCIVSEVTSEETADDGSMQ